MNDPANPAPEVEKTRNGLPAPVNFVLKFIMYLGLAALVFWVAMSFVLNYYLKESFEMYLTGVLHQPTKIRGGIRLGTDLAKPSLVLNDIFIDKSELIQGTPVYEVEKFEAGLPWQTIEAKDVSNLSFFVKIENLRVDGKPYGSYEIPVHSLPGGDFEVKGASGSLKDAAFTGDLAKTGTKLEATGKATGIDYGQVVEGASGGKMEVDLKLTGSAGADIPATLPFVSGTVQLTGGEGKMAGSSVGFWSGNVAQSALGDKKETKINCVLGDFTIELGVAKPKALIIDTDDATIYGQGYIDFSRQYLDMVFTPRPKQGSSALAVPLNISGPFTALVTTPDAASVAAKIGMMAMGLPSALLQPLPPAKTGENACVAYIRGAQPQ